MQTIGKYQIQEELGRGGMGKVYRAYDPQEEREVAVKVMPPALAAETVLRQRFEQEAKIIAALQHPCIVPVHDFGEDGDQLYLVMGYMSGGSLADKLAKQGAMGLKTAAPTLYRIAQALEYVHKRGIVHRDVKTANVLFDERGRAHLADFGIARLTGNATRITATNMTIGTASYMSPEQIVADKNVDHRTDIYSLGIIFYEMLTGRLPYEADTPAQTMMMHILQPVPSLLTVRPDFSYGCEEVLQGALAKDKFDRYNSAMEFAQEVRRLAEGQAARPRRRPTRPLPTLSEDGSTAVAPAFNEQTLLQQQPSTGSDLIDYLLSHQQANPQERQEARLADIREMRRQQEEADRQRQIAHAAEVAELRAAEEARRQEQARQAKLIWAAVFGTIAFLLVLALLISVLS